MNGKTTFFDILKASDPDFAGMPYIEQIKAVASMIANDLFANKVLSTVSAEYGAIPPTYRKQYLEELKNNSLHQLLNSYPADPVQAAEYAKMFQLPTDFVGRLSERAKEEVAKKAIMTPEQVKTAELKAHAEDTHSSLETKDSAGLQTTLLDPVDIFAGNIAINAWKTGLGAAKKVLARAIGETVLESQAMFAAERVLEKVDTYENLSPTSKAVFNFVVPIAFAGGVNALGDIATSKAKMLLKKMTDSSLSDQELKTIFSELDKEFMSNEDVTQNIINRINKEEAPMQLPFSEGVDKTVVQSTRKDDNTTHAQETRVDKTVVRSPQTPQVSRTINMVVGKESQDYHTATDAVKVKYAIVEGNDLLTSDKDGYPATLQPRDRDINKMSTLQVSEISNKLNPELLAESPTMQEGAPVITKDGVVISGNGRTMAIMGNYATGEGESAYKKFLINNAERFGVSKEEVSKMSTPILVRVIEDDVDDATLIGITRNANISNTLGFSATNVAQITDEKVTPEMLSGLDLSAPLTSAKNMAVANEIIGALPPITEQARYRSPDGSLNTFGVQLVKNVLFKKAYGSDTLLAKLAEGDTEGIKTIFNAMLTVAPKAAVLNNGIAKGYYHDINVADKIKSAVEKYIEIKELYPNDPKAISNYLKQQTLFGDGGLDLATREILTAMEARLRSGKKLTDFFSSMMDNVIKLGNPNQGSMFGGGASTENIHGVIKQAAEAEDKTTINLFSGLPLFNPFALLSKADELIVGAIEKLRSSNKLIDDALSSFGRATRKLVNPFVNKNVESAFLESFI